MHEIAHMILGIIFKMKPNKLEINPFGFSISFNNESTKIKEVFGVEVPYWIDSLKKCINNLKN